MKTAINLLVICVMAIIATGYCMGLKLLNVQTGSMRPTFGPGDTVVVRVVTKGQIHKGDIVTYKNPRNPNQLITHRVVRVGGGLLQTKGDALTMADPAIGEDLIVGREIMILPNIGSLLDWLHTKAGLAAGVYLPMLLIVICEIANLHKYYGAENGMIKAYGSTKKAT